MNGGTSNWLRFFSRIPKRWFWLIILAVLALTAFVDFFALGLARRTFVFYAIDSGIGRVEDRKLPAAGRNQVFPGKKPARSSLRELDITRYVEEALLGPISPDSLPLFPRDTRLVSLLYRDGVVYVNLTENAALPPLEGGEVFRNMETLHSGIRRNFPYVRDVRFFIVGKAAYAAEFR